MSMGPILVTRHWTQVAAAGAAVTEKIDNADVALTQPQLSLINGRIYHTT